MRAQDVEKVLKFVLQSVVARQQIHPLKVGTISRNAVITRKPENRLDRMGLKLSNMVTFLYDIWV